MPSILTRHDYEAYLIRLFFGPGPYGLRQCSDRAYRDFNRTLHGIGLHPQIRTIAEDALHKMLTAAARMNQPSQVRFDGWHRQSCSEFIEIYERGGYSSFSVGHAQKWLNMTFKYVYLLGEQRIGGFHHLYEFCHVPIDNILMEALRPHGFKPLGCAWSRWDDYDSYIQRQRWFRERFKGIPLDVEFQLWMGREVARHD